MLLVSTPLPAIVPSLIPKLRETIIMPNMDDVAFFDTRDKDVRGGVFSQSARHGPALTTDPKQPKSPEEFESSLLANGTSAEDPTSAVAESSASRKRNGNLARPRTLGTARPSSPPIDEEPEQGGFTLPRTETAPATVAEPTTTPKRSKWFNGSSRSSSVVLDESRDHSTVSLNPDSVGDRRAAKPASSITDNSSGPSGMKETAQSHYIPELRTDPVVKPKSSFSFGRTNSNGSSGSSTAGPSQDPATIAGSATSIISSLRRGGHRRELLNDEAKKRMGQMSTWMADRKERRAGQDERPPPAAPPAEELTATRSTPSSDFGRGSLQERLHAAALVQPSPSQTPSSPNANRQRSGSIASSSSLTSLTKPALASSPSKSNVSQSEVSTDPPQMTIAASRATTEESKEEVLARTGPGLPATNLDPNNPKHPGSSRRPSGSPPLTAPQPSSEYKSTEPDSVAITVPPPLPHTQSESAVSETEIPLANAPIDHERSDSAPAAIASSGDSPSKSGAADALREIAERNDQKLAQREDD